MYQEQFFFPGWLWAKKFSLKVWMYFFLVISRLLTWVLILMPDRINGNFFQKVFKSFISTLFRLEFFFKVIKYVFTQNLKADYLFPGCPEIIFISAFQRTKLFFLNPPPHLRLFRTKGSNFQFFERYKYFDFMELDFCK